MAGDYFISFALYDSTTGAPLTGQAPVFDYYGDITGSAIIEPTIIELGAGKYGFSIPEADIAVGMVYLIYGGATSGRYISGSKDPDGQLVAFHFIDEVGDLYIGATPPVFLLYDDNTGAPLPPPFISQVGTTGIWFFTPTESEVQNGAAALVEAPPGTYPSFLDITVNIEGGGVVPAEFDITSLTPHPTYLDIVFSKPVGPLDLSAKIPSSWIFNGIVPITCTDVSIVASQTVRLTHTEPRGGAVYSLTIPINGLKSTLGVEYNGPGTVAFTAVAQSPTAIIIQVIDYETIRLIYSEEVDPVTALVATNYVADNELFILEVTKESGTNYILKTSPQAADTTYTITISNVTDLKGNPV